MAKDPGVVAPASPYPVPMSIQAILGRAAVGGCVSAGEPRMLHADAQLPPVASGS